MSHIAILDYFIWVFKHYQCSNNQVWKENDFQILRPRGYFCYRTFALHQNSDSSCDMIPCTISHALSTYSESLSEAIIIENWK